MLFDKSLLLKMLIELIFMWVLQINGCVFCLDMYGKFLCNYGFDNVKMDVIVGWKFSNFFSEVECVVLDWVEVVIYIIISGIFDSIFNVLKVYFIDIQIFDLIFVISIMNVFN